MIGRRLVRHFLSFKNEDNIEEITFLKAYISYFYPLESLSSLRCCFLLNGLIFKDTMEVTERIFFFVRNLNGYWQSWSLGSNITKLLLKNFLEKGYFGKGGICVPGIYKNHLDLWVKMKGNNEVEFLSIENGSFKINKVNFDSLTLNDKFFIIEVPYRMLPFNYIYNKSLLFTKQWWGKYQFLYGEEKNLQPSKDKIFYYTLECLKNIASKELNRTIEYILNIDIITIKDVLYILKIVSDEKFLEKL